jgi:hypothetical protein
MTTHDKKVRSEGVIAVNLNQKKLVFADSMKLFGDFMNSSKDMIKNCVRKGKPYKGWFIFYLEEEKRAFILDRYVINDQDQRQQDRHSDKAKAFYIGLYNTVNAYLKETNPNVKAEYFSDFELLPVLEYKDE